MFAKASSLNEIHKLYFKLATHPDLNQIPVKEQDATIFLKKHLYFIWGQNISNSCASRKENFYLER